MKRLYDGAYQLLRSPEGPRRVLSEAVRTPEVTESAPFEAGDVIVFRRRAGEGGNVRLVVAEATEQVLFCYPTQHPGRVGRREFQILPSRAYLDLDHGVQALELCLRLVESEYLPVEYLGDYSAGASRLLPGNNLDELKELLLEGLARKLNEE